MFESRRLAEFWVRLKQVPPREVYVLAALFAVVLALWGFVEIADEVREGDTQRMDEQIVRMLRSDANPNQPIGPHWLAQAARDVTSLGGYPVLTLVVLAVAGFCALVRRFGTLWLVLTVSVGGVVLTVVLKHIFSRPRPDIVPHLMDAALSSFPSGHAMASATIYLALAAVIAQIVPSRAGKYYVLFVALVLTGLVGCSRVFLGVHYPTDVLAGWAAGLAWAMLCWLVARYLRYRRVIHEAPLD